MTASKLSISLESPLVEFLAQYQEAHGLRTRSEVIAQALTLLRDRDLEQQYVQAAAEWAAGPDAEAWDAVSSDGL